MTLPIDEQVTKTEARRILRELERAGVNVDEALDDLKQRSPLYNVFYAAGMTGPVITYASV